MAFLVEHDIVRLQVSVNNVLFVEPSQSDEDFRQIKHDPRLP